MSRAEETTGRRRLSLNVMLNCRTLLQDVDRDEDTKDSFDHGGNDEATGSLGRVGCRRGTSSYNTCRGGSEADMSLRTMAFRAFLDGITLSQLKDLMAAEDKIFPSILIPELLSWAIHLDKSPRHLSVILNVWPYKCFNFDEVFSVAFEGRAVFKSCKRSRFKLNGFNTIAFGPVSRAFAWRYDSAISAVISALAMLMEEGNFSPKECKIQTFDLRGVPLSDYDFGVLTRLVKVPIARIYASAIRRKYPWLSLQCYL